MRETANWILAERLSQSETQGVSEETTRNRLLAGKRQQQRDYIAQDGTKERSVEELGAQWTHHADTSLDQALAASWRETKQAARFVPADLDDTASVPGLFVLGLGKLGGGDLNFSSDVDLVAYYDAGLVPVPEFVGRADITARVLRTFTQMIDGHKAGAFVWRTDWRLRPDPSVTDLSMSTEAGEDYHFYRAAPWRRLAMIKARVVAGDMQAGQRFLRSLHPYLWRRHLDFSMIQEIAHLKSRIRREHPDLAQERKNETPLEQTAGFHLKLGSGGIRDIEFFVNAQQLLWGGRHPHLQTPSTMTALRGLAQEGIVEPDTAAEMERCYWLLRGLENRVQYWSDGHTHFVPDDSEQQEWLAARSGFGSWAELGREIADVRQFVDQTVAPLFADVERPARATVPDSVDAEDDEFVKDRLQTWELEAGSGQAPGWIWQHASQTSDPLARMKAADGLFRRLGNRGQYLKLLSNDPKLFEAVVPPLFQAPAMASLLEQSAHVVDGLLGRASALPLGPELDQGRAMIAAAGSYEGKLEAARAWVNEQLYLTYLSVFSGSATIQSAELHLTQLAEAALTLVAEMVMEDLGLETFPLCILGMGKMGMRAMAPHSDLDLIFVVEEGWELEEANIVAARFNTAFNAQMREGRVWEVDTRLRPSGRSGPPTISLASFETHHLERAKTWEHIAQVPMRPLSGSDALRQRVTAVKQRVLRRPRDLQQLTADAYRMLLRLRDQRIFDRPDDPGEVKLRPGGLMELEYLLAVETLRGGAARPEAAGVDHDDLAGLWGKVHPALATADTDLRRLRDWFFAGRLFGPKWMQRLGVEVDEIESVAHRVSNAVNQHLDSQAQALDLEWVEYQEQAVRWTGEG